MATGHACQQRPVIAARGLRWHSARHPAWTSTVTYSLSELDRKHT